MNMRIKKKLPVMLMVRYGIPAQAHCFALKM